MASSSESMPISFINTAVVLLLGAMLTGNTMTPGTHVLLSHAQRRVYLTQSQGSHSRRTLLDPLSRWGDALSLLQCLPGSHGRPRYASAPPSFRLLVNSKFIVLILTRSYRLEIPGAYVDQANPSGQLKTIFNSVKRAASSYPCLSFRICPHSCRVVRYSFTGDIGTKLETRRATYLDSRSTCVLSKFNGYDFIILQVASHPCHTLS